MNLQPRFKVKRVDNLVNITDSLSRKTLQIKRNSIERAKYDEDQFKRGGDETIHNMVVKGVMIWREVDNEIFGLKKVY